MLILSFGVDASGRVGCGESEGGSAFLIKKSMTQVKTGELVRSMESLPQAEWAEVEAVKVREVLYFRLENWWLEMDDKLTQR